MTSPSTPLLRFLKALGRKLTLLFDFRLLKGKMVPLILYVTPEALQSSSTPMMEFGTWWVIIPLSFLLETLLSEFYSHSEVNSSHTSERSRYVLGLYDPETMHQLIYLFGDRGIPDGYRFMNGYGSHAYELVNEQGVEPIGLNSTETNQGIKSISVEKAAQLASSDPDYAIRDLYNAIGISNYQRDGPEAIYNQDGAPNYFPNSFSGPLECP